MSFVCPYCFTTHNLSEVQFRCTNKLCPDCDDVEMTRYENGDIRMPKQGKRTFGVKSRSVPQSAKCPGCGMTTYKHICPSCHNELPASTLSGEDMIISVVGSRATGKSHFVGVIIYELINRIAASFGGSFEGFADSYQRWQTNFGTSLYYNNVKLELTQSSLQNVENGAYRPLIFNLKMPKNSHSAKMKSYTFVFFDTAGEDLNDEDTMSIVNRYICKSAGIIFLLDPMQITAVSDQLDNSIVKRAAAIDQKQAAHADDIMVRVSNLIRKDKKLPKTNKIDIPVAAVLSKFDTIEPLVPRGCIVLNPSPHCKEQCFDMSDWHNVNSEVLGLLRTWDGNAFISQLENNYSNYSYFAVSALGLNNNPDEAGKIERPRPHRIEDPLLWLLKENGVIKGK